MFSADLSVVIPSQTTAELFIAYFTEHAHTATHI